MSDELELLIDRYLDGRASGEEVRRVDLLVRTDAAFRSLLMKAAGQTWALRASLAPRGRVRFRRAASLPSLAAAGFLIVTLVAILVRRDSAPDPGALVPSAVGRKILFNGVDLHGWKVQRGRWEVAEGAITGSSAGKASSRVETVDSFTDFELVCKVRMTGTSIFELQIRDYSWFVQVNRQALTDWKELRIVARGESVRAALGGADVAVQQDPKSTIRPSGPIAFYTSGNTPRLEIRDVTLVELK